jgi:hypothetical protein
MAVRLDFQHRRTPICAKLDIFHTDAHDLLEETYATQAKR